MLNLGRVILRTRTAWLLLLKDEGDEFALDGARDGWCSAAELAQWLRRKHVRISPRALTLTMFLRLFVADHWNTVEHDGVILVRDLEIIGRRERLLAQVMKRKSRHLRERCYCRPLDLKRWNR